MSKTPTIQSVIEGFADDPGSATGLIPRILDALTSAGIPLDLGPMTPDVRAKFDAITKDARAQLHAKFHRDDSDGG